MTSSDAEHPEGPITLQQAADRLGVHYMTAYRYVRLGQLPARKVGAVWQIDPADVDLLVQGGVAGAPSDSMHLADDVHAALLAGDEGRAWDIVSTATAAGLEVEQVYLQLLRPALHRIGEGWACGEVTIAQEHRASAVATRLVGRLGQHVVPPGRRRGHAVVGAAPGDNHALPTAMFADLLRARGLAVIDLGSDIAAETFERVVARLERPVVACVTATTPGNDAAIRQVVGHLRRCFPWLPMAIGGTAVADADHARRLGSAVWDADPARAAAAVADLVARNP